MRDIKQLVSLVFGHKNVYLIVILLYSVLAAEETPSGGEPHTLRHSQLTVGAYRRNTTRAGQPGRARSNVGSVCVHYHNYYYEMQD